MNKYFDNLKKGLADLIFLMIVNIVVTLLIYLFSNLLESLGRLTSISNYPENGGMIISAIVTILLLPVILHKMIGFFYTRK